MKRDSSWVLACSLLVKAASAIESSGECALATTTTVYLPTTIYVFAPNITSSRDGISCVATSSSITRSPPASSSSETTDVISTPTSTSGISTSSSSPGTTISSTSVTSISTTPTIPSNGSTITQSSTPINTGLPTPTSIGGLPPPPPPPPSGPFRGYKNAVYFTNWGISQEKFLPHRLPVDDLSHILYAFADIAPNGTVISADPVVDLAQKYPDDDHWERGRNAYGAVKQLYIHKKWNRQLKVLLSVGGGQYSPKFAAATSTEMRRQTFAKSAVKLVTDWGFDGIDIDWEYPTNEAEKESLVKLVAACREAFDRYSFHNRLAYRFLVTVASPAGPANWEFVDLPRMDRYVDIWHLMSYDYSGSWYSKSGHQANVFANQENEASTPLNTDDAVRYYKSHGIHGRKIVIGSPLYGRSFNGTSGLGQNYTSVGSGGPSPGVWYYKDLPKAGSRVEFDDVAKATYSYDAKARELITYDDVRSTEFKARYVRNRELGGAFFWEASGDRAGRGSLVKTMYRTLDWLERTPNNLRYPTSQYMNIRRGMPGA
ncbi:glycoside hydrolase superfamily [Xylaria bambusicola]|uniref:glycoside hydrolase superfamily n=1 Tax=Xylaria bambusicola TaxID=326684 RepID=UPI002007522A|nr:glycoside hydrolase superfamily [Xylaria bambusicola]KAI0523691.1 glycoside hydrolase superfamily [Xylaria bambusicola]